MLKQLPFDVVLRGLVFLVGGRKFPRCFTRRVIVLVDEDSAGVRAARIGELHGLACPSLRAWPTWISWQGLLQPEAAVLVREAAQAVCPSDPSRSSCPRRSPLFTILRNSWQHGLQRRTMKEYLCLAT